MSRTVVLSISITIVLVLFAGLGLMFTLDPIEDSEIKLKIGHNWVRLPLPEKFCVMSPDEPIDATLIAQIESWLQGSNRPLLIFAKCGRLASWRDGKTDSVLRVGYYATPLMAEYKVIRKSRAAFLASAAKSWVSQDTEAEVSEIIRSKAAQSSSALAAGQLEQLGMMHHDESGIYLAALFNVAGVGCQDACRLAAMTGMTVVNQKLISITLYDHNDGDQSFDALLEEQRTNVNRLIEAN